MFARFGIVIANDRACAFSLAGSCYVAITYIHFGAITYYFVLR